MGEGGEDRHMCCHCSHRHLSAIFFILGVTVSIITVKSLYSFFFSKNLFFYKNMRLKFAQIGQSVRRC